MLNSAHSHLTGLGACKDGESSRTERFGTVGEYPSDKVIGEIVRSFTRREEPNLRSFASRVTESDSSLASAHKGFEL